MNADEQEKSLVISACICGFPFCPVFLGVRSRRPRRLGARISPREKLRSAAMPSIDMPLEQLRQYKPSLYREDDFESFWDSTVAAAVAQPLNAELIPFDLPARDVQSYAV